MQNHSDTDFARASVTLYGNWRSSSSQRVACALHLKNIDYTYRPINLDQREQEGEAFRALHPGGQLPVLVMGDQVISQSMAILESLDELFPDRPRLLPVDLGDRLRAREIAQFINSRVQPFQLPRQVRAQMRPHFALDALPGGADAACSAFVRAHLEATIAELERLVARSAGLFAVGDAPGLADCLVIPQLHAAVQSGVDLNRFATLSRLFERCSTLPAFRRAHPRAFPDAPTTRTTPDAPALPAPAADPDGARVITETMAYKEPDAVTTRYLLDTANEPIPSLEAVRAAAFRQFGPVATKISAIDVCLFLRWLAEALQPRRVVEVGVFTGSSSLALLAGMPPDGHLYAYDVSADYTDVARAAWAAAGFDPRVTLHLEDAAVGLPRLAATPGWPGSVDLAYVDGLNTQYQQNHEDLLPLLRPGGVIVYDNVLWKGLVAQGAGGDAQTVHLRELNARLRADPRVHSTVIGLGDGLALVVKR